MFRSSPKPSPAAQALVELEPGDVDTVRADRIAWRRLRESPGASFESHMTVARALKALRKTAEKRLSSKTGRKTPQNNGAFNVVMGRLLEAHDLADTSTTYRWGALWCLEHLKEWRRVLAALPEGERAFHNYPPHVRGLVIAARRQDDPVDNHVDRRAPAARLEAVTQTLRRHFPLASTDQLQQAAADAIESYCGHALPETLNRRIGRRVPNQAVEAVLNA
jgi:hypothetical protein